MDRFKKMILSGIEKGGIEDVADCVAAITGLCRWSYVNAYYEEVYRKSGYRLQAKLRVFV